MTTHETRQAHARDLHPGDTMVFENFRNGRWITIDHQVADVQHLITLDYRRITRITLEGHPTPLDYADRAPVVIR